MHNIPIATMFPTFDPQTEDGRIPVVNEKLWIEVEHRCRHAARLLQFFPLGRAHIAPIQAARLDEAGQDP